MKKLLLAAALSLGGVAAHAAPVVDFASALGPSAAARTTFNSAAHASASVGGILAEAFLWSSVGGYTASALWIRNQADDHGLGVCSAGEACGALNGSGSGDFNELSNNLNFEVIRLTRPDQQLWSELWVSSLDSGGSGGAEKGTLFFSNSNNLNLGAAGGTLFGFTGGSSEKMVWTGLESSRYVYFIAGPNTAGTNNDYLVWGASLAPVPEPETYAMLLAGLGLLGLHVRRRNRRRAA